MIERTKSTLMGLIVGLSAVFTGLLLGRFL